MYVLFRKGMNLACGAASTAYILWFVLEEYARSHGWTLDAKAAVDGLMLLVGVLLLLCSYYHSLRMNGGPDGGDRG
ncbi:hypothetical protein D1872_327320 [compost metagenome]